MPGYAPMSQGWFDFWGYGVVKNWKWLWGTATWWDKLGNAGIKAGGMVHMGTFGGISQVALNPMLGIVRSIVDGVHGKPEALETSEHLPEIIDLYRAAEEALQSSDEDETRRRYREFKKQFDKLDPKLRWGIYYVCLQRG